MNEHRKIEQESLKDSESLATTHLLYTYKAFAHNKLKDVTGRTLMDLVAMYIHFHT